MSVKSVHNRKQKMVLSLPIVNIQRPRSRFLFASLNGKKNDPENEPVQLTLFMLVLMSKPSTKAVPPDMVSSPVNILKVVVFPAPLIPRRPKHSLMGIPRLKRSTATNGPRPRSQKKRYRCHHNISACYHRVSLLAIISVFWLVATISV